MEPLCSGGTVHFSMQHAAACCIEKSLGTVRICLWVSKLAPYAHVNWFVPCKRTRLSLTFCHCSAPDNPLRVVPFPLLCFALPPRCCHDRAAGSCAPMRVARLRCTLLTNLRT